MAYVIDTRLEEKFMPDARFASRSDVWRRAQGGGACR